MKRLIAGVVFVLVAASASAVTVVLKDGRRIQVASAEQRGNYLFVRHESGRMESYPLAAVDQEATQRAAAAPAPTPVPTPAGPQSPFARAVSSAGESTATLTDEDLPRRAPAAMEEGDVPPGEDVPALPGAQVELIGYEYNRVEEGVWDVTVTVINRGGQGARSVGANVRLLGEGGQALGSGSGRMDANLDPGSEGRIVARVRSQDAPAQISVNLQWQEIRPEGGIRENREGETAPPRPQPGTPEAEAPRPRTPSRPEGSSPMTMPDNPMSLPSPVVQPRSPQAPPPPR